MLTTNQHVFEEEYAVVTKRIKKNKKNDIRKIWLKCDRKSIYKSEEYNKKQSFFCQIDCLFSLIIVRDTNFETWSLNIIDDHHNHKPTLEGSHVVHRKNAMTKNIKDKIVVQTRIHFSIKQILSGLRFDDDKENSIVKPLDIYNIRAKHRREELRLYNAVQTLMLELSEEESWYTKHTVDHHDRITKLFFAKTSAQKILKLNYEILLMNCIYKTNVKKRGLRMLYGIELF